MSSVKTEVFVKSTAALEKEVREQDLKAEQKDMKELLDATTESCGPRRIQSGNAQNNGKNS